MFSRVQSSSFLTFWCLGTLDTKPAPSIPVLVASDPTSYVCGKNEINLGDMMASSNNELWPICRAVSGCPFHENLSGT